MEDQFVHVRRILTSAVLMSGVRQLDALDAAEHGGTVFPGTGASSLLTSPSKHKKRSPEALSQAWSTASSSQAVEELEREAAALNF
eukprot:5327759-Prymnesium_polylepis.1